MTTGGKFQNRLLSEFSWFAGKCCFATLLLFLIVAFGGCSGSQNQVIPHSPPSEVPGPKGISRQENFGVTSDNSCEGGEYTEDDLQESYEEGWNEAVEEVFLNSPSGTLYYGGEGYSEEDFWGCAGSYYPPEEKELYTEEDLEEAYTSGWNDAVEEVFAASPYGCLCYGEERYYGEDFER